MKRVLNACDRYLVASFAALLLLASAYAQQGGGLDGAAWDAAVSEFLSLPAGFEDVAVDELELALLDLLPETGGVFSPTGALDALSKAVMVIEAREGRAERSRYQLSVSLVTVEHPEVPAPSQYLFVRAGRYDVGPVVHAQLVEELGADVVAPLEEFGAGPNVAWRFVMQQLQGHRAALVAASRRVLPDEEAAQMECLYGPCLSVDWEGGPPAWEVVDVPAFEELAPMFYLTGGEWEPLEPEVMAAVVSAAAGFDPYISEFTGQGRAVAEMVIDRNTGQGMATTATLRQGDLLDDSLAAIWHMAVDFGASEARSVHVAYECRRGEEAFSQPGDYCP